MSFTVRENSRVNTEDGAGKRKKFYTYLDYNDSEKNDSQGKGSSTQSYSDKGTYNAPTYSYTVKGYDPSSDAAYQQALSALQTAYGNTPSYTPSYDAQINEIYDQIMNRGKFKYSLASDPLYQEAREQYTSQGQLAMMNTMGQAAALTGGYGSSYSQAVGQQQYNAYLQSLNELVPEYYDRAFNQWQQEGNDLYNKYSLTKDLADTEYSKYRDDVSDYWNNINYLASREDSLYSRGADNYWNTENANMSNYWNAASMANDNYWNQKNMEFENYWNSVNAALSQQKSSSGGSSKSADNSNGVSDINYSTSEYNSFKKSLDTVQGQGRENTNFIRARLINDKWEAGLLSDAQATKLMKEYGISDELYERANG